MNGETDATAKWAQDGTVLLVALEPRCYREAIGEIVAARRQALFVKIVEPDDLVAETAPLRRGLVLCSRKKHPAAPAALGWIEYYFADDGPPTVFVNGQREEHPVHDLDDVLSLIDRTLAPPQADHGLPSAIESMTESLIGSLTDSPPAQPSTP